MKKILLAIVIIAGILAAIVFYQRQKISGALRDILKGRTYGSYGVVIEVPPTEGRVRGIFKPYVNLPRVVLNLSAWGLKMPLNLDDAVVFQDLWGNGSLILEVPRVLNPTPKISIAFPSAELTLKKSIKVLSAEKISFVNKNKEGERIDLLLPQLQFGKLESVLPDLLVASLEGVLMTSQGSKGPKELQLGSMNLGMESEREGGERQWTLFSFAEGGLFTSPKGKGEVGGWKFQLRGTAKDLPFEELRTLSESLLGLREALEKEKAPGDDSKNTEQKVKPLLKDLLGQSFAFFSRLQLVPRSKKVEWEGLKVVDAEGSERFLLSPIYGGGDFKDSGGGFEAKVHGEIKEILVRTKGEKPPVTLKNLEMSYSADYFDTNFSQLTAYIFRYYQNLIAQKDPLASNESIQDIILYTLAQYPNEGDFKIGIGKIAFTTKNLTSKHENFSLGFSFQPKKLSFAMKDQFEYHFEKDSLLDIEGGKGDLKLEFLVPWSSMIQTARRSLKSEGIEEKVLAGFLKENVGLVLDFLLDLGPNYFVVDLDSKLNMGLEKAFEGVSFPKNWKDKVAVQRWAQGVGRSLVGRFLKGGSFSLDLEILRLSKLQETLDRLKPGASLGLVVVAPYAQVDNQKDSLKFNLELKEGEVLINGTPNPTLQKLIQPAMKEDKASWLSPGP